MLFAITSVLCGLAPGFIELMIARIAQGVSSAMIAASVPTLIVRMIPDDMKGLGIAVTGAAAGCALFAMIYGLTSHGSRAPTM